MKKYNYRLDKQTFYFLYNLRHCLYVLIVTKGFNDFKKKTVVETHPVLMKKHYWDDDGDDDVNFLQQLNFKINKKIKNKTIMKGSK